MITVWTTLAESAFSTKPPSFSRRSRRGPRRWPGWGPGPDSPDPPRTRSPPPPPPPPPPRPTAHRLAVALEHHRLVARDMQGRFILGPRLAELSAAAGEDRLLAAAGPV